MKNKFSLVVIFSTVLSASFAQSGSILGFSKTAAGTQAAIEKKFDANLSATNVGIYIKDMTAVPHHVGSPGGKAVAEYILDKFKSWGYDAVIENFYVLFPTPKTRLLEMVGVARGPSPATTVA